MQIVKRDQNNQGGIEINIFGVLQLFWKNIILIIAVTAVAGLLVFGITRLAIKPKYSANIVLYANNSKVSEQSKSMTANDINASVKLVDTYKSIILTDTVMDDVIRQLNLDMTANDLIKNVSIDAINESEVFRVTVTNSSPEMAAKIANKIGEVAPAQIESIVDGCSVRLVNEAKVPTGSITPYRRYTLIGMFIGLVLVCGFLVLRAVMDNRIKSEDDLKMFGLPMLAKVPDFAEGQKMGKYGYSYQKGSK